MEESSKQLNKVEQELAGALKTIDTLTDSNQKYALLLNHVNDFIWVMNKHFDITWVSPSANRILGFTDKMLLKKSLSSFCPPTTLDLIQKAIHTRMADKNNKTEKRWEFEVFNSTGATVILETITTPYFTGEGHFDGIVGVSRNITERKNFERQLSEHEASLNAQINNTSDVIWSIDTNYRIKTMNDNFKQQFKIAYGIDLKIGSEIIKCVPVTLRPMWKERYDRALKGERFTITDHFNFENVAQYVEIRFNPIRVGDEMVGVAIFSRDVTQQTLAEIQLSENEANQRALLENTDARIWSVDSDLNIILANKNFVDDFKRAFDVNLAKGVYALKNVSDPQNKIWEDRYRRALNGEKFSLVDEFNYKGVPRFTKTHFNPIIRDSKITGVSCLSQDITQQIISEKNTHESEERFKFLSKASIELLQLKTEEQILNYVTQKLQTKLENSIVLALKLNDVANTINIVSISGISEENKKNIQSILGFELTETLLELPTKTVELLRNGKFTYFKNGLSDFKPNNIKNEAIEALQKKFQISNVYTVGLKQNNNLFLALQIIGTKGTLIDDSSFIESYANLINLVLQQKQLVQSLYFSQEKFQNIFQHSNAAISIQTNNRFLLMNRAWVEITGYSIEEGLSINPENLLHPNFKNTILDFSMKQIKGELPISNYQVCIICKNKQEKWLDISTSLMNFEGQKAILVIGSDITDRKNKELRLNQLSAGITNTPMSIVITNNKGIIEYVNPYFCQVTGYSETEALGKNPRILKSGNTPKETFSELWNTILTGKVWMGELQNRKKDGTQYCEKVRIAPIFSDDGTITHFISIKEDITKQKQNLNKIEDSERKLIKLNAQKDKFFSIIAHDLRSPFSGLVGLADMLHHDFKKLDQNTLENYLGLLSNSSHQVLKLVENLLAWARTQTGRIEFKPQPLNVKNYITDVFEVQSLAAKNKQINLIDKSPEDIFVKADANMLLTILRNLISNAIKYTHKSGIVSIETSIKLYNKTPFAVISISDTGVGIPLEKQDKLFKIEENYTTIGTEKEKGNGLGLILCKEFVEMHGGKIWCSSIEGSGSSFFFSLPLP
ncbi:MAG: hypothetical protein CVU09_05060 [Bacteroidetes bacterium HGW-Bacteroidetes-4]|jgi:PAS domain S-box-containing protein|nr:MAG: hypothetical protein CVU09_05060 [Bacteroidetes bacterium HGW-Bacteroidetes-4]